ncbi:hypothetical protein L5515_007691 [Caenorhabditis briggsae]|uniref:Uncharacterized protein n=1 Tax=Caenorhabditis briggsae TaxID=6238 RepID=A0AAE9JKG6_CAEBR|nr:hypothetical protein L5515_007691 [Caenorhabditis briggsae]
MSFPFIMLHHFRESIDSSSSRRGSLSGSQLELNKTIAHTIEVTSKASEALDLNMQDENNRPPTWSETHTQDIRRPRKTESKITLHSRLSSSDLAGSRSETSKDLENETPRPTSSELKEVNRIRAEARAQEEEEARKATEEMKIAEKGKEEDRASEAATSLVDNESVISQNNITFSEMPSDSIPHEDRASLPSAEPSEAGDAIKPKKKLEQKDSNSSMSSLEDRTQTVYNKYDLFFIHQDSQLLESHSSVPSSLLLCVPRIVQLEMHQRI